MKSAIVAAIVLLCTASPLWAQEYGTCDKSVAEAFLDANNVRAIIPSTGQLFWNSSARVYEIPQGSGIHSLFAGSLWLSGLVDGDLRAAAGRYRNDFWAGPLPESGDPPSDCEAFDRVYKLNKSDVDTYESTGFAVDDLDQWPTGLGAPTVDSDGNVIDIMAMPLAARQNRTINLAAGERPIIRGHQSIWWVMNDRGNEHSQSRGLPMGIEVHANPFAVADPYPQVDNATLYHYRIFNRNQVPIEEMYVGMWLEGNVGNDTDDFFGSDSLLGMGYAYNQDNEDDGNIGYGTAPPAIGLLFLEGPVSANERLGTTVIGTHYGGGCPWCEPSSNGDYFMFMRGMWKDGERFTVGGEGRDFSETPTDFMFAGDPVQGEFWSMLDVDGQGTRHPYSYPRFFVTSGPFNLAPGEGTDFTMAIVWARGTNYLDSITELRTTAEQLKHAFDLGFFEGSGMSATVDDPPISGPELALAKNYPNPFFESTRIKYRVPSAVHVELSVFDILGRKVATLVDGTREAGEHSETFLGQGLPPGVYFYRIQIGSASATVAMVLQK